jgi:GcrA cell cycle regulator
MAWTNAQREEILRLFQDGNSASEIAHMKGSGMSRGAVMGVIHRARKAGAVLRSRNTTVQVFVLPSPKAKANRKPPRRIAADVLAPVARTKDDGSHIGTFDLGPGDCRWPHGAVGTPEFYYCAQAKAEGSPYCEYHTALAWRGTSNKPDAA